MRALGRSSGAQRGRRRVGWPHRPPPALERPAKWRDWSEGRHGEPGSCRPERARCCRGGYNAGGLKVVCNWQHVAEEHARGQLRVGACGASERARCVHLADAAASRELRSCSASAHAAGSAARKYSATSACPPCKAAARQVPNSSGQPCS
jgi:hypothetical protein